MPFFPAISIAPSTPKRRFSQLQQPSEYNRCGVTAFAGRADVDSFLAGVATTAVILLPSSSAGY